MSSHRVEQHLAVAPDAYDVEIRRLVPGYEAMHDEVLGALAEHLPPGARRVLDLGAGTGALSERIARARPDLELVLLDADPGMLAQAERRLHGARVELRHGSFTDPLPPCDAAVASLALHHVHAADDKRAVYRNILAALAPGGVLVNADAAVSAAAPLAEPVRRRWAAHLVAHGDSEARAYERFAEWATEDRYFGVEEELDMLRAAGFTAVDVRWRVGPTSVLVARKAGP
jgi:tRNA (cmo5U34)-methyltransferase